MPLYNQIEVSAACPMNEELQVLGSRTGIVCKAPWDFDLRE